MVRWVVSLMGLLVLGACASTEDLESTQGGPGDTCYPNGTCNSPLVCVANLCVGADAGTDASSGGSPSGGSGGAGGASGGAGAAGGTGGATGGTGGTAASGGTGGTAASGGTGGTAASGGTGGTAASGGTGGTGGATGAPPPPGSPSGCTNCCCDPWLIKWSASAGATYYNVLWKCSINPLHTINVGSVLQADLCSSTVGMCASSECAYGVGLLQVQACNTSGCSAPVSIPASGVPSACGGGCCC